MANDKIPKTTQLRDYYAALGALKEDEQMLLAKLHAKDATRLINRFLHSVKTATRLPQTSKAFHDNTRFDPATPPVAPAEIESTFDFASQIVAGPNVVAGRGDLAFRYVDREVFPGRTGDKKTEMAKRTLDLLLVNSEGLPIIGELKRGGDSLTYYALVQALMHAAELVSETQRERLAKHYPTANFSWPDDGPFLNIYLIAYAVPSGANREPSRRASVDIIDQLLNHPEVSAQIGRIELLEAVADGDRLAYAVSEDP